MDMISTRSPYPCPTKIEVLPTSVSIMRVSQYVLVSLISGTKVSVLAILLFPTENIFSIAIFLSIWQAVSAYTGLFIYNLGNVFKEV